MNKEINYRKIDARFALAWDDETKSTFTFLGRVEYNLTPEQTLQLTDLGGKISAGPVFTAHELDRETILQILDLSFVKYLNLSAPLHME